MATKKDSRKEYIVYNNGLVNRDGALVELSELVSLVESQPDQRFILVARSIAQAVEQLAGISVQLPALAGCYFEVEREKGEYIHVGADGALQVVTDALLSQELYGMIHEEMIAEIVKNKDSAKVVAAGLGEIDNLLRSGVVRKSDVARLLNMYGIAPSVSKEVAPVRASQGSVTVPDAYRNKVIALIREAVESGKFPSVPLKDLKDDEMSILPADGGSGHKYKQMANAVFETVTGESKLAGTQRIKLRKDDTLKAEYFARIKAKLDSLTA
ncbi:hypothetical protein OYT40_002183 [Escherichia coli]|nr:hypothetical protein [Escherichia coli]